VNDYLSRSEQIKAVLRATYNAAADHFDDAPLSFWDHCGRRTVEFAGIGRGDAVLDVCCGAGGSALPAAERVGPAGRVVGVDLAERLLERARAKARERRLDNVELVAGDLTCLDVADASFDVVLCVFGIFLAPDMDGAMAELWRTLRPGGTLVVTTWGVRLFEPANTAYWDAVEAERPDLRPPSPPQLRIAEPAGLTRLFVEAGAPAPEIERETLRHPAAPEDFWTIVQGSGHRLPLDLMGAGAAGRVRTALLERMACEPLAELTSDVLYARAGKD
jgi:SAM-dependent methyltransferase